MPKSSTRLILRNKFPAEQYVLLAEVPDHVGQRNRSLDFMVVNLWGSRGYSIIGIEVKSHRGDWLKELKTPDKQESHFKHCDYFYLLTDKDDVAKLEEIPITWGWYHITKGGTIKTMKQAPKLKSIPVPRELLCGMLRRADDKRGYIHVDTLEEHITIRANQIKESKNYALEREAEQWRNIKPQLDLFEKITGISITQYEDIAGIGEAVRQIRNGGLEKFLKRFERISEEVKSVHDRMLEGQAKISEYINSKE